MRASLFAAAAVLLFSALSAHADIIQGFDFNSDLTGGYTAQGVVNIDLDSGLIIESFFTLSQNGVVDATFANPDYSQPIYGDYLAEFQDSTRIYSYALLLPYSSLVDFAGGQVCTVTNTCLGVYPSGVFLPGGGDAEAIDGILNPTPEPASVVMLATGLAAGFAVSRRRWA